MYGWEGPYILNFNQFPLSEWGLLNFILTCLGLPSRVAMLKQFIEISGI